MDLAEARAAAQAELDSFSSPEFPLRLAEYAQEHGLRTPAPLGW
jgi:hypothetical protein